MVKPLFTKEQIRFYILQFRKVNINTLEGRRRLIDSFVNSVVVYDDYILVTFNYKEGADQITFEQIERSDLTSLVGPKTVEIVRFQPFFSFVFLKSYKRCDEVVTSLQDSREILWGASRWACPFCAFSTKFLEYPLFFDGFQV